MQGCTVCESDNWMTLTMPAVADNLGLARVTVAAFAAAGADFTLEEVEEIKVVVSEGVSNVVLHAYPEVQGQVTISARLLDGVLTVTVADEGRGIEDVQSARQASYTTRKDRMGLGFSFMESFTDGLVVDSAPGEGTEVTMTKAPSAATGNGKESPGD